MWGLMLKDLINIKKTLRVYAILIVFYGVLSYMGEAASGLMGVIMCLTGLLPITAISYDERAKWDRYALTMPVSRRDMVLSKYLLGIALLIPALLVCLLFGMIVKMDLLENAVICLSLAMVSILIMSLVLPIIYRFGVERGRIAMMIVLFTPTILIYVFARLHPEMPELPMLMRFWFLIPIGIIVLLILSILLSIRIYNKKEF